MTADLPIEIESLLARCMGDKDFTREMMGIFRDQAAQHLAAMEAGLKAGDAEAVRKVAHAMKGSAANLSAAALAKVCSTVEQDAKTGKLPSAAVAAALKQELARVLAYYPTIEAKL